MSENIPAPTTETPSAAPAAPASAPAENPAPPVDNAPAPDAVPTAEPAQTTLLGDEAPAEEAPKPTDQPKEDAPAEPTDAPKEEPKPDAEPPKEEEAQQTEEPAPLPIYEFELPEHFQKDDAKFDEFTKKVGQFELDTKADHGKVQALVQDLLNEHTTILQETVNRIVEAQTNGWDKQKSDWKEAIEKDPELGGNRADTTKASIRRFIQTYGGSQEDRAAFSSWMNETGIGNYPLLAKMIARAGEVLAEGRPLPGQLPSATANRGVAARINKMYSS